MEERTAEKGLSRPQQPGGSEGEAVHENIVDDVLSAVETGERQDVAYGCVFCVTGKERQVAERISSTCPDVSAIAMRQLKYRTHKKVKTREEALVLPGYVFFRAPLYVKPVEQFPRQNLIRVLTTIGGEWQLTGEDEHFVRWLFQYDGLLEFSQAYKEDNRIRIVSGPLKDMEGKITRIDKRGRSGQVVCSFGGRVLSVWLNFELIEPME